MESKSRNRNFDEILVGAIDEAFSSLGASCKQSIYFQLEKAFKIKKNDIPYKIEEFTDAIEKLFGPGAKILEIKIIRHLYEGIGHFEYFLEQENLGFTNYVKALRQYL